MKRFLQNLKKYALSFLQVQCFLSLVSLPVIVAWGLPISLMTAVGNFVFSPFITAFLLCSSLIFFSELLHIPNGFLIVVLEWITKSWLYALSCGSKTWLIGFPLTMLPFLCFIALCSALALQHKTLGKPVIYILLCCCFMASIALVHHYTTVPKHADITCVHQRVSVINNNGKLHLIDHGGLGEKRNPTSWINYTLMPTITKTFGTTTIDHITYYKGKRSTQKAVDTLYKEMVIHRTSSL